MRYETITPAYVRAALGLPNDPRLSIEIDWEGREFRDTECDIFRGQPAAVHVNYVLNVGGDEEDWRDAEAAYSWAAAEGALSAIVDDDRISVTNDTINVRVNAWALVYAAPQVAA